MTLHNAFALGYMLTLHGRDPYNLVYICLTYLSIIQRVRVIIHDTHYVWFLHA